jgi:hypothetical protein
MSISPLRAGQASIKKIYCSKFSLLLEQFLLLSPDMVEGSLMWLPTQVRWVPTRTALDVGRNRSRCKREWKGVQGTLSASHVQRANEGK